MDARLQLRVLGPFQMEQNGRLVTRFESDKARALLVYLALEKGPHSRESLSALLWPDLDSKAARHNLSQVMFSLRQLLAESVDSPLFLANRYSVDLDPAFPLQVDTRQFNAWLDDCRQHVHGQPELCSYCAGRRRQAVTLYRGNLLEGLTVEAGTVFDNWLTVRQERFHRRAIEALQVLARYHEWRGEYEAAREYAQRQVALEPWREEAHRQLMRLLAYSGQRSAALVQYRLCRQALQAELGLEPSRETEVLAERIRQADAGLRHNLPAQLMPFVGRTDELATISSLLAQPECRVLALTGPGGVGKTRLALQVTKRIKARFLDGVWFVPLVAVKSDVKTAETLPLAIADALHFTIANQSTPLVELLNYLRPKELLLLLDNFESLQDVAGTVAEIVRHAPQVKVLVTSRERPNLAAASLFNVSGLDVPVDDSPDTVEASSAGQLFVRNARRASHDFVLGAGNAAAISRICKLVEGLPLALELAARWTRTLSCAAVLAAIEQNIDFLTTSVPDVPRRHRSVRAVIDHSWKSLAPGEQIVFSQLSVFPTSFTRQAAIQVTGAALETLAALVDKSLVRRAANGRYVLHELLRQYADDRLAAMEAALDKTRQQHALYYAGLLQEHEQSLSNGDPEGAVQLLEAEWGNVRAAWRWAVVQSRVAILEATSDSLFWWCRWSNRYHEGRALFQFAAEQLIPAGEPDEPWLAGLLGRYGYFCTQLAEYEAAQTLFARSVPVLRHGHRPSELAQALNFWGDLERQRGAYTAARSMLEESVSWYRKLGAPAGLARALGNLGAVVHRQGEYAQARQHARESLGLYRQIGNRWGTADALYRLGYVAYELGEFAVAERYYSESLNLRRELGDQWGLARTSNNLGIIYYDIGDYERAEQYYQETLALREALGDRRGTAVTLNNLGLTAAIRHEYIQAEQLYRQSLNLCLRIGNQQGATIALNNLGEVAAARENYEQAYAYHRESLAIAREIGYRRSVSFALEYLGLVALNLSQMEEARHYFIEALEIAWETQAMPRVLNALHGLAQFYHRTGDATQAATLARIVATHQATEQHTRTKAVALLAEPGTLVSEQESANDALETAVGSLLEDGS